MWLVGASSGIGAALASELGRRGAVLCLSARRLAPLEESLHGASKGSMAIALDVTDAKAVQNATDQLLGHWGHIDLVVWLAGTYHPLQVSSFSLEKAVETVNANIVGPLNGLAALLDPMTSGRCRGLAMVSSVAGYRGLPQSMVYGPTKAAITNLTESLYLDLHASGVGIWVINPGFVETALTSKNQFKMPALLKPDEAATAIIDGFADGVFEIHFPKRFTRSLKLLRTLPYRWYFAAMRRATK
ncbi:MAG: SDR family NAD(P)-dependent oxidoreductase [Burkholderiaceae bacterium]